jgi:transposase
MDMSNLFRKVVQAVFPNAVIICDRFHIVRMVL